MVKKPTEEEKVAIRKEIFDLAEKYKGTSIQNQIKLNKYFVVNLFPKYVKKYGAYEAGLIFKEIHDELEKIKNGG